MGAWEYGPAELAVIRAFVDGDPLDQAGGPLDVRAVVAGIRPEAKDGFLIEEVPWERFPDGTDVREDLERSRSGEDCAVRRALSRINGLCANDMRAAAAPAVPFLVRFGTDQAAGHRAEALTVSGEVARMAHQGVCRREDMLRFLGDDEWRFEVTGYPQTWSVRAAREAITADADLLLPVLDDPDPAVRVGAAYALAAAVGRARHILAAVHARLTVEHDPAVRAGLVLAIAQLARAHRDLPTTAWMRTRWADPDRPPEVRVSAALGWLCLTDEPVPDDLRTAVDDLATSDLAELLEPLPWMQAASSATATGLRRCVHAMLHPDIPDPSACDDPWA
ncbi:hypothetical protein GCM10018790_64620 [Kitasatospora xanthocidica]|uniref:hypothetical protein n=1 Tax=Kitasatospora xanthocidica TaxID=83382 RepID=UPI0019A3B580|nr:hypothetical protein [Kitasatospora xanthocidica]GHF77574.1 hypothetical protein GCM10018790_64620 [Kitasatospora xanthocidica]